MRSLNNLIKALAQYDKILANTYLTKIQEEDIDVNMYEKEIISIIKKERWIISQGKRNDDDYSNYIEKYMVEGENS